MFWNRNMIMEIYSSFFMSHKINASKFSAIFIMDVESNAL